ncbi:hypothetical protein ACFL17_05440 [Pseudomonadota bacterium]
MPLKNHSSAGKLIANFALVLIMSWFCVAEVSAQTLTGLLTIQWGDPPPEIHAPGVVGFELASPDGTYTVLTISDDVLEAAGGTMSLDKQWVNVELGLSMLSSESGSPEVIRIERIQAPSSAMAIEPQEALSGSEPWITLPCKFKDENSEPKDQAYFNAQYGDDPGELNHFWKTESYNNINIDGSTSPDWLDLPNNRSAYITEAPGCSSSQVDHGKLFSECVAQHDSSVDFSAFTGINLVFNGNLDGCAWGGGRWATLDGVAKVWPVTWLPPFGYFNNSVFEHENGHGYGLPHSTNWDNDGYPYDNLWDYMSGGQFFPGSNPYGSWGTGGMAYHKEFLQWLLPGEIVEITAGSHTVDLDPLGAATATNARMIKLPLDANKLWTIEAREKTGVYEIGLPGTAVIISEVQTSGRTDPIWVYDETIPPGNNNNNEGSMWKIGETFVDAANSISVEVLQTIASGGFRVRVTRPGGCSPALLELSNGTVNNAQIQEACEITAGPNYEVVGPNGNLTLNANIVRFESGFKVVSGGTLTIGSGP